MKKRILATILLVTAVVSGCSANGGSSETIYATPTPIPYEQHGYYDTCPGFTDIEFNTTNIQNVGGQEMPVYANGSEISISVSTDVVTSDLLFEVEPMQYQPDDELIAPLSEPIVVSYANGGYTASFTDSNNCLLGYYMRFADPDTDATYFDAIVACGDISVIGQ